MIGYGAVMELLSLTFFWQLVIFSNSYKCPTHSLLSKSTLKLNQNPENGPKKHVQNVTEIVHGFSKLVVIFLVFRRCGYEIPSLASFPGTICEKVCFNLWFRWSLLTLQGYHNFTVHFLIFSDNLNLTAVNVCS